jgi:cytochrome oxidase Cu insertion factor (SCO1/SenC/PrrC family)
MAQIDRVIGQVQAAMASPRAQPRLVAMLVESARCYRGLSSADAEWVKANVYAAFAVAGLPSAAMPLIHEELRTSMEAPVLAGIARALRAQSRGDSVLVELLRQAAQRIGPRDEYVRFEFDHADRQAERTASEEIAETMARMAATGPTCCGSRDKVIAMTTAPKVLCRNALATIELEDQFETTARLDELLVGRTTLIGFFYTRCMNPDKCSLTITRLGQIKAYLSKADAEGALQIMAISYDPDFDSPEKLAIYGADRGFAFDFNSRIARCTRNWPKLQSLAELRVGYAGGSVNVHAREAMLVYPDGTMVGLDPQMLADPQAILAKIQTQDACHV